MVQRKYQHQLVGKKLGHWVWFHVNYLSLMTDKDEYRAIITVLHSYASDANIVKLNEKSREYQLISCPRFNEDNEPALAYTFDSKSLTKRSYRNNPPVFHQKHLFVRPDYIGFDLMDSESRTATWKSLVPTSDNGFYLKIGRQRYWNEWLAKNGLEPSSTTIQYSEVCHVN